MDILCADPTLIFKIVAISSALIRLFSFRSASAAAMFSFVTMRCARRGCGASSTEVLPLLSLLVRSYTCCRDAHGSLYCTFVLRRILAGLTPSLLKKHITDRFSNTVHVDNGVAISALTLLPSVLKQHTPTCWSFFESQG